jgi:hypothetical protein
MSRKYDSRRHHHSHDPQRQANLSIKIEPSEIPKLSLTNLQHENGLTPPLRNRDVEGIRILDQESLRQRTNDGNNISGKNNKFGGGKFPPLGKTISTTEYFQGDEGPSKAREQRKIGGRLPPRELQPLSHASSEKLIRDNHRHQNPPAIPSRRHGRGSLEPLNPMLKSNSLSKIDREPQRVPHALESNLPSLAHRNSLVPLHNSGRIQPSMQSTRPW